MSVYLIFTHRRRNLNKQQMKEIVRTYRRKPRRCAADVVERAIGADLVSWPKWLDDLWNEIVIADTGIADTGIGKSYKNRPDLALLLMDLLCSELRECP